MIFKCKICGGDIELNSEKGIGTCLYCGCVLTIPKHSDEQHINSFNRGNYFRQLGEFDKAFAVYEDIIKEDEKDAEAHWCAALCRFGIEYVEDPTTMEYIPTCHRASFENFTEDIDYLAAIKYSDGITQRQYQKDGKKIEEVQKAILATSSKEDPFDIFICYKESDENSGRTQDSVLAQDIYDHLTEKSYKVFFSRITLEEKVGSEYEPYIFAALNSAKVMIVVGTSKEHLDAVWVKNEWSRFLAMMKKDRSKVLLPCYKDMNPYDMPEALSVLQSYNMAAIGFSQDLLRGIGKIIGKNNGEANLGGNRNDIDAYKNRSIDFLENGEFSHAIEYCEKILDICPSDVDTYIVKLCAEKRIREKKELAKLNKSFENDSSYKSILKYGSDDIRKEFAGYLSAINDRLKNRRKKVWLSIAIVFLLIAIGIGGRYIYIRYKERQYVAKVEQLANEGKFAEAKSSIIDETAIDAADSKLRSYINAGVALEEGDYATAKNILTALDGYMDSDNMLYKCRYEYLDYLLDNRDYDKAEIELNELIALGYEDESSEKARLLHFEIDVLKDYDGEKYSHVASKIRKLKESDSKIEEQFMDKYIDKFYEDGKKMLDEASEAYEIRKAVSVLGICGKDYKDVKELLESKKARSGGGVRWW
ncbi:MAG: toll/interleukin-1 receptor domain-containing protein [Lachnospiraceae bacterium]|nr:toll/interleukin-1 receptor domain-containing protein [Lachnospiraceae bacterium]